MATLLVPLAILGLIGIGALVMALKREERERTVRVQGGLLHAGKQQIALDEITSVTISPLYDVAPADDLWTFAADGRRVVWFFNRDHGASESLKALEDVLFGFCVERSLQLARDESVFENPVAVWSPCNGYAKTAA
jgi:hypothetical protein